MNIFQAESPSAGGFTAIGFYLLSSLFFLTAAFIESIYIISLHQSNKSRYQISLNNKRFRKKKEEHNGITKSNNQELSSPPDLNEIYKDRFDIQKIDYYAFVFSGISFFIFNIVYWVLFLFFTRKSVK